MQIMTNLGMYVEDIVNKTISFYLENDICLIEKRNVPIQIIKRLNNGIIMGKLLSKSYLDYFAYINNRYIEFECKQTSKEFFDLSLIKKHQIEYFYKLDRKNIYNFLIIYFEKFDYFLMISFKKLVECNNDYKKKKVPFEIIKNYGKELKIIYPCILNLIESLHD